MPTNINGYVYLTDVGGTKIKPITDLAAINMTTSNGIEVQSAGGGTIGIVPGYIESKYYNNMVSQDVGPASPQDTYVDGGTMYTLLGGYAVSDEVPSINADPYKVPSEVAVRAAIDAYVATGGTDIVPGKAINVTGGSINVTTAEVEDLLNETTPVDTKAVTPEALLGALSVGQAVDVSCAPYTNTGTITYGAGGFLDGFTVTMVSGTTVGFYDKSSHSFPKFAKDGNNNPLHYIFIADVSGTGTITPNGYDAITLSNTPQRISTEVTAEDTGWFSATAAATVSIANWRQYEVTALTAAAKAYIASAETNPDPDALFRSTNAYSILNKYLIKQDMVSPFVPIINMDNKNVTIGAGLAYSVKLTDGQNHEFTVDTIPSNGYGWDSHLQLFIAGTSEATFVPPLALMNPLTPGAGHNITIKWRAGQALAYVDDTDIGYVVSLTTGTSDGSLTYGIVSDDSEYIVFSEVTDGTPVEVSASKTLDRPVRVLGNGVGVTALTGSISVSTTATNSLNLTTLIMENLTLSGNHIYITNTDLGTATISSGTVTASGTNAVSGVVTVNGILKLENNSVLNMQDNAANVPITGTGTVSVPSGTAYVLPYGGSVTVPITGASPGNAVNKYGKCGYLVSNASSTTGANTLYDALVGGGTNYSNVIFDPALNGSTIGLIAGTTVNRNYTIDGNGIDNSIITGSTIAFGNSGYTGTLKNTHFYNIYFGRYGTNWTNGITLNMSDCLITGTTSTFVTQMSEVKNCTFDGVTNSSYALMAYTGTFEDCTITNCGTGPAVATQANDCRFYNCTFTNNSIGVSAAYHLKVIGCTFSGNTTYALQVSNNGGRGTLIKDSSFLTSTDVVCIVGGGTISNCLFNGLIEERPSSASGTSGLGDYIISGSTINGGFAFVSGGTATFIETNIINSTVSGTGTVVFADGAVLDLAANSNEIVTSGGTVSIPAGAYVTIKPYGGGSDVTLEGGESGLTGTQLSNAGVLS